MNAEQRINILECGVCIWYIGSVVSSLTSSPKGAHTLSANCLCDFLHMHALRNHSRPLLRMTAARSQKRELRGRKFLFQTSLRSIVFRKQRRKKVKRYNCMNTNCVETRLNIFTMRVICVPIYIESVIQLIFYWLTALKPVKVFVHQIIRDSIKFPANLVM